MFMLIFALLTLTALISLILSALALHSLAKSRLNHYLAVFTLFLSVWAFGDILMLYGNNEGLARFGAILFYVGPMVTTLYLLFFADSSPSGKPLNRTFAISSAGVMVLLGGYITLDPNFLIQSIHIHNSTRNLIIPHHNPLLLYAIYFNAYFVISYVKLIRRYRQNTGIYKSQLLLIVIGVTVSSALAVTTNLTLPLRGVYDKVWLGPIFTLFFASLTIFAIIKHRYLDIKLFTARATAYGLVGAAMTALYAGAVSIASQTLFVNSSFTAPQQIFNVSIAILIAITFGPLRRMFDKATNKLFYRDHYEPEFLLNNVGAVMAREIELQRLTDGVLKELTDQMRLSKTSIIVLDKDQIFFEGNSLASPKKYMEVKDVKELEKKLTVRDLLDTVAIPEVYKKYDIEVSVGLESNNELIGYLLLGPKKSGDIYNETDIKTLSILANELAVAIHNAKSYTQIQNFNKTLQIKVDEATSQLRDANEHLKELDEIKNEFLSMATHQLNTPLAAVDGYLSMMTDGIIADPKEQHETMEKLLHRVRMMKHLVTDFLNVSRLEAGTFVIEPTPVDLNKMVTEQVNELGPTAKEKAVFLQYIAPKHPLPLIEIDEEKISQAVMNLIDNAIYYTPKGTVKVYLDADEQNASFKVVDNGIGVPEAQKAKLFQKFARADNARKERPNGNGVGLYLVKLVVEAHGGKIIFESAEGKGSTFGFSLPLKVKEDLNTKIQAPKPTEKEVVGV